MKISKVSIRNFRSIEQADVEPTGLNVLVGQNNHGKTNFFEAVEWFYNGSGDLSQIAFLRDQERDISVEIEYTDIQAGIESIKNEKTKESFKKFAGDRDVVRVIRRKSEGGKRLLWDEISGEWSSKNFAGFDRAFNDCLPRLQYVSTTTRLADISKYGKKTPIGEMLSGVLTAILEKSPQYVQFREKFDELFASDDSEVKAQLSALAEKVKNHLEQQFPDCVKVSFGVTAPAFDDLLKSFETSIDDGIETLAEEKGDGMQRALMLAIIKTYSDYRRDKDDLGKRFLFLIDEAELHLHPTAQRQLKDALARLADNGDQVFINTHSSVLVADQASNQSLWKVRKAGPATEISSIGEGDKPEVVYELLGGSPADLLFPNNFLIVEGRSEGVLIANVVERFYSSMPRVKVIFSGGDSKQERSMDAINAAFTPLNQTPVYKDRLVILCDKPSLQRSNDFDRFRNGYPALEDSNRLIVAPVGSLEEAYPSPWTKDSGQVAKFTSREKTDLAKVVGLNITQTQFEREMPHVFRALRQAWALAHQ